MLKLIVYENGNEKHIYTYSMNPEKAEKLKEMIDAYLTEQSKEEIMYMQVKQQDKTERIFLNQVRYFVSDRRKIKAIFGSPDDFIEFYMKMQDVEKQLEQTDFLRCHQSYMVNIRHILYWNDNSITLTGNETIPISRKYKNSVIRKLKNLTFYFFKIG